MTVCIDGNAIVLRGSCGIEEVEPFVGYLEARPDLPVDLTGVEAVHTALWQAIMVYRPIVTGSPNSPFLEAKLLRRSGHRWNKTMNQTRANLRKLRHTNKCNSIFRPLG
jgi:hypothetical protein